MQRISTQRVLAIVSVVILLSLSFIGISPKVAFAQNTTISLAPTQGVPGTVVTVTGGGWSAGDTVDISFGSSPAILARGSVASDGSFTTNFTVPANTPQGTQFVDAIGETGSETAQAQFTVTNVSPTPTNTPIPTPTLTPTLTPPPTPTQQPTPTTISRKEIVDQKQLEQIINLIGNDLQKNPLDKDFAHQLNKELPDTLRHGIGSQKQAELFISIIGDTLGDLKVEIGNQIFLQLPDKLRQHGIVEPEQAVRLIDIFGEDLQENPLMEKNGNQIFSQLPEIYRNGILGPSELEQLGSIIGDTFRTIKENGDQLFKGLPDALLHKTPELAEGIENILQQHKGILCGMEIIGLGEGFAIAEKIPVAIAIITDVHTGKSFIISASELIPGKPCFEILSERKPIILTEL